MMYVSKSCLGLAALVVAGALIGCGTKATPSNDKPSAEGAAYRLSSEPADAKGVKEGREVAKNDDQVTLVGRIGGDTSPFRHQTGDTPATVKTSYLVDAAKLTARVVLGETAL
jgi:hypothetical protein